jgi:sugar (pentulose or hexulose) kinase
MTGGATASAFWQSLIADVTGLDVFASTQTDSPALGAAILAAASDSGEDLATSARRASADRRKVSPSDLYEYYQTKFNAYKEWRRSHP